MKIRSLWPAVVSLVLAVPSFAETHMGFRIGTINAPLPPVVVAHKEPRIVIVPNTRVYRILDDRFELDADVFLFTANWYVYKSGYWYTSRTLRGRYHALDARAVPYGVLNVHQKHWKHHPDGPYVAKDGEKDKSSVRKPQREKIAAQVAKQSTGTRKAKATKRVTVHTVDQSKTIAVRKAKQPEKTVARASAPPRKETIRKAKAPGKTTVRLASQTEKPNARGKDKRVRGES